MVGAAQALSQKRRRWDCYSDITLPVFWGQISLHLGHRYPKLRLHIFMGNSSNYFYQELLINMGKEYFEKSRGTQGCL